MVSRTRACLFVIFLCASLNLQAAIKSSINHSLIEQGESIQLNINLSDVDGDKIDLTPLEQDFEVLGRSQQSSTVIRNGRIESSTELVLTLLPKRAGDLQIPPISIDGDQTESHALRVSKVTQPAAEEGGIEMLSTLSSQQPKVQQPLIYQTNLLVGRQIFNASLQGPEITVGKALIEPLGEQRQYQQTLNGRQITVVEQTWLITPEQSGPLEISPAQVVGQIQTGRSSRSMRRIQVSTQGYQLEVAPIPASFSGSTWLPAENITLTDNWSSDQFAVGEPLTRTITLRAEGLSRNQITELTLPDVDGIKQYASAPEITQQYENDMLTSTLTLEVTLIPERAGELALPDIRIPWWNVKSNSEQIATLAARSIKAQAAKTAQQQPAIPSQAAAVQLPATTTAVNLPDSPSVDVNRSSLSVWWVALFGALVGSAVTIGGLWLLRKRSHLPRANDVEAGNKSHASMSGSKLSSVKLSNLKAACTNNDASAARLALIGWGQQYWPQSSNLNQLSLQVSPELQQAIVELHRHSYSQKTDQSAVSWQGAALWKAVQAFNAKEVIVDKQTEKLAPLFLS